MAGFGAVPSFAPSTNELEQIRYALDQAAIVAITDVTGRITYVNQKFCEISKYSRHELIGKDHRVINSGFHSKDFIRDLWQTIARGHIWRGELRNRAKDGSLYWVDTTIVPFLDDLGKPRQYMAIRYDITERKRHEQRLLDQAALTSLGEMAAVVAHEVRNPLAGIRSGMQLLQSLFPDVAEGRDLINEIIARVDSLNAVVGDLLTFARVRALHRTRVDLATFVADIVSSLQLDPSMTNVEISVHIEEPTMCDADEGQMRLVLMNLILNAAQAMNHSGRIAVAARPDARGVELTVTDSGPGIPAEIRDRVFEPFFTTKHRGTGLGLPTARRIVEAHGGEISIANGNDVGTVVRITLPSAG
jgi:two-component system CheB/CheR fusion protein